jgi:hypothetical protein
LWLPLTVILTLVLPSVKGALVGCNGRCACAASNANDEIVESFDAALTQASSPAR